MPSTLAYASGLFRVPQQHALRGIVPANLAELGGVLQAREQLGQSIEHPDDGVHDLDGHFDELGLAPEQPEARNSISPFSSGPPMGSTLLALSS